MEFVSVGFSALHVLFPLVGLVVCVQAYGKSDGRAKAGWFNLAVGNAGHLVAGLAGAALQFVLVAHVVELGNTLAISGLSFMTGGLSFVASGFLVAGFVNLAQAYCGLYQSSEPGRSP